MSQVQVITIALDPYNIILPGYEILSAVRQEGGGPCFEVHGKNDHFGLELVNDPVRVISPDGVLSPYRDHQDIHLAYPLNLFFGKRVPEVSQVNQAKPVEFQDKNRVQASLRPLRGIMICGDSIDLYVFNLPVNFGEVVSRCGQTSDDNRAARKTVHLVMVHVLMTHRDQVRYDFRGNAIPPKLDWI